MSPEDFIQSKWEFLQQPLNPPRTDQVVAKNGNEQITGAIVEYLTKHT
jgi:hypothetical protein